MKYRPEIDGLRAIAVIPVILFHAGFSAFSGGFVGVDIFFVISGYLITTIILADLDRNQFSVIEFYERRARRILPALFAVVLASVVFAWLNYLPSEMKTFGQSIAATSLFSVNIFFFLKNNDYFGLQSESNPTLHLWSLSVEEQFYVGFPIVLIMLYRLGWKRLYGPVLLCLCIASLLIADRLVVANASAAFFLLPSRAWELLLGALLAVGIEKYALFTIKSQLVKEIIGLAGFAMITISIFVFDKATPSPSLYLLVPTLGAAMIILVSDGQTKVGKILSNRTLVGIGLISYSAYLWHQPLLAFSRHELGHIGAMTASAACAATLAIAYASWRFIESPFRNREKFSRRFIFSVALAGTVCMVTFGFYSHYSSGIPQRSVLFSKLASNYGLSLSCNGNIRINSQCSTGPEPDIAVFGNSYAMHLVEGLKASNPSASLVQLTQDSCRLGLESEKKRAGKHACSNFIKSALDTITTSDSIDTVVISSPFNYLLEDKAEKSFDDLLGILKRSGKRIVIVSPPPANGTNFANCYKDNYASANIGQCDYLKSEISSTHFKIIERLRAVSLRNGVEFIDLTEAICNDRICRSSYGDILVYMDSGHLSREGSRYLFTHKVHLEL